MTALSVLDRWSVERARDWLADPLARARELGYDTDPYPFAFGQAKVHIGELLRVIERLREAERGGRFRGYPTEIVNRILWNARGDDIDEIVISDCTVHIEQMSDQQWWIGITRADGGYWAGNFTTVSRRGRMRFTEQEREGFVWDRDDAHDERGVRQDVVAGAPAREDGDVCLGVSPATTPSRQLGCANPECRLPSNHDVACVFRGQGE